MNRSAHWVTASAFACACAWEMPQALAQAAAPLHRYDVVTTEESVPDRGLIVTGGVLLGLTYTSSVIVATTSDYGPDDLLYVPVVGPWLDLGARDDCSVGTAPSCRNETLNDVLLVANGLGQGIGALQIVAGIVFPVKRQVTTTTTGFTVRPNVGIDHVGLTANATF